MITDSLVKSGAADAAVSSKQASSARKGADDSAGFSSALSGFDRDAKPKSGESAEGEGIAQPNEDNLSQDEGQVAKKPIIDLKPTSLRQLDERIKMPASDAKAVSEDGEPQIITADKKLRDALAGAKALIQKADTSDKRGETTGDAEVGKKIDTDAPAEKAEVALIDVLSLLAGPVQQHALEAGAANQKNAIAGKRGASTGATDDADGSDTAVSKTATGTRGLGASASERLTMPTDTEVTPDQQRLFRFSSARDNQSMDMAVGGRSTEKSAEFKTSGTGTAENVTVLDSRRFLGLAANSNSAALTAAISGDREWSAALHPGSALSNAAAQSSTGSVVNTLKLQMNPHDLGSVTAMLRLRGEELNVHLTVETRAAYRQLSEDSSGIVDALRSQGFAVDQVTISIAPTADTDSAKNQQNGNQPGQQATTNGERQNNAGRGQEQTSGRQQAEDGTRTSNDAVSDTPATAASGSARPEQLYL